MDTAKVVYVVDGDTAIVRLEKSGVKEKVRIARLACPEMTGKQRLSGIKARKFLVKLINGKKIRLISDPGQSDRDKFGRLLRFIYYNGRKLK